VHTQRARKKKYRRKTSKSGLKRRIVFFFSKVKYDIHRIRLMFLDIPGLPPGQHMHENVGMLTTQLRYIIIYTSMLRAANKIASLLSSSIFSTPLLSTLLLNLCPWDTVRSLSVSFFIEKEPRKQLRMKRKRKGEG
jgi:hypothetical protein